MTTGTGQYGNMPDPRHARPRGWRYLRTTLVLLGLALAPVFFWVMFDTVTTLLRASFGSLAWTVPVATEGSFAFMYGLDILLQWRGKPQGWLRWTPYPFAAASLLLNVYAYRTSVPGMTGHAVVTVAFFLPLIAGESAVKNLSVSDAEVSRLAELASACRYARDLMRDQKGMLWRLRVPSLLRTQIVRRTPPAEVIGALAGGMGAWEPAVERWVVRGLTRSDLLATEVVRESRAIAQSAAPVPAVVVKRRPSKTAGRGSRAEQESRREQAERMWRQDTSLRRADIIDATGISPKTADRVKQALIADGVQFPHRGLEAVGA